MLNLRGIYGREMFETLYKMNVLIESGLDISPVITHRFAVEEFESTFATAASHESGKVLITGATSQNRDLREVLNVDQSCGS